MSVEGYTLSLSYAGAGIVVAILEAYANAKYDFGCFYLNSDKTFVGIRLMLFFFLSMNGLYHR